MTWTGTRFPKIEQDLRSLAKDHLENLKDQPLHLAIVYSLERDPQAIFLFELLSNFGSDAISEDNEFFEVAFESSNSLRLEEGQWLHLVLTNPNEFHHAVEHCWSSAEELREAIRRGEFEVLYKDHLGDEAMQALL